jgi:hypothetical protein
MVITGVQRLFKMAYNNFSLKSALTYSVRFKADRNNLYILNKANHTTEALFISTVCSIVIICTSFTCTE